MKGFLLSFFVFLLFFSSGLCLGPPKVDGSYKAWGETVQAVNGMPGEAGQEAFQESYDADSQNAAFLVWVTGINVTFVENFKTKQTYRYSQEDKRSPVTCETVTLEQSRMLQFLEGYEDAKGVVRFALKQFFDLPENKLSKIQNVLTTYRNITARKWTYEFRVAKNLTTVQAFWSEPTWNTTSPGESVPLGFIMTVNRWNQTYMKVQETFVNVYGFVPNTYDRKIFEPVQGVVCPDRVQTLKFPNVRSWKSIAVHSEMAVPRYREVKYVDTWYNPIRQLMRIDSERVREEDPMAEMKEKKYESEIAIQSMEVVFRKSFFKGKGRCEVIPFKEYKNDLQNFYNVKGSQDDWSIKKFFGLDETNYTYIGKTIKTDIPCHLFQGIRTDWPEKEGNITSLWEWCFNVNMSNKDAVLFQNGEIGLVSAQVTIKQSANSFYEEGLRMFHHFYEVTDKSPSTLGTSIFDISQCFNSSQYRALQFTIDWKVGGDNKAMVAKALADKDFLYQCRHAISDAAHLSFESLRVANVKATIVDIKFLVQFFLLDVHPDLPRVEKLRQKSAYEAEVALRKRINDGTILIKYRPEPRTPHLNLTAVPHSLEPQINSNFTPHTLPPPTPPSTPPTPSKTPFSLITDNDSSSSSVDSSVSSSETTTENTLVSSSVSSSTAPSSTDSSSDSSSVGSSTSTPEPERRTRKEYTGHQPGAVAAVAISMVLIGITIGSGGAFIKYYGLPSCISR